MKPALQTRNGLASLGLAGLGAVSACSPATPGAATDAMADCYASIQKALVAVQLTDAQLDMAGRADATRQLDLALERLEIAWARREGIALTARDIEKETPLAMDFIDGIEAEAGLEGQELMTEMTEASDHPDLWRGKYEAALDCAARLAP